MKILKLLGILMLWACADLTAPTPSHHNGSFKLTGATTISIVPGDYHYPSIYSERGDPFDDEVFALSLNRAPKRGLSVSLDRTSLPPGGSAHLTIRADAAVERGLVDTLFVRAIGQSRRDSVRIIIVAVVYDFHFINDSLVMHQNEASPAIIAEPIPRPALMSFAVRDVPSALRVTLMPPPLGETSSFLHVIASSATTPGVYHFNVIGTFLSGSRTETHAVTITVLPAEAPLVMSSQNVIGVGINHGCALDAAGSAYCWGFNAAGQLGDSTNINRPRAVAVVGGHRFRSISAEMSVSCAVTFDNLGYCWGDNGYDQLARRYYWPDRWVPFPSPVESPRENISLGQVKPARYNACGLTPQDNLYCWGQYIIGNDTSFKQVWPTLSAPASIKLADLTMSTEGFACGLTSDGTALCWGRNDHGQLGNAGNGDSRQPVPVATKLRFKQLAASGFDVCGLTNEGAAYCWGGMFGGNVPTEFAPELRFGRISAGVNHYCALTTSGRAICWGEARLGQVGDGIFGRMVHYDPVGVTGNLRFVDISSGWNNTCAIATNRKVYCWGSDAGYFSTGAFEGSANPLPVGGNITF